MVALQRLSDAEKYLLAILTSPNGVDLAEMCLEDVTRPHGRYRLYDYQYLWFICDDKYQIDQCARSVGKSESIKLRAAAMPFCRIGRRMLLTAPELNHLKPITDIVQETLLGTRILREMLPDGKTAGVNKAPHWQITFKNGTKIISRLPNVDGRGVKSMHVSVIELDEAQNYPKSGWTEVVETLNPEPDSQWRVHGVSTGARDSFFDKSQPGSGWTVHRVMSMMKPAWTERERLSRITEYDGSRQSIDYKRNIYGEHGDASSAVFVLSKVAKICDLDSESPYNSDVYKKIRISLESFPDGTSAQERMELIHQWISVPETHHRGYSQKTRLHEVGSPSGYSKYFGGMDVGLCVDTETEILTKRGWLKWDVVAVGDEALSLSPETGLSEWQPIVDLYKRYRSDWDMIKMEGQSFSAVTTPHHKWLVIHEPSGRFRWRQTRELNTKDYIPLSADRGDEQSKLYKDDFVELVAWYMTEGDRSGRYHHKSISQSISANPELVSRIEALLRRQYGEPGPMRLGPYRPGLPIWRMDHRTMRGGGLVSPDHVSEMMYFKLGSPIAKALERVAPGPKKIPVPEFLTQLTQDQARLFVEVCILADGWIQDDRCYIERYCDESIRSMEMVCALAGIPTSTSYDASRPRWHLALKTRDRVAPVRAASLPRKTEQAMTIEEISYDGTIWCPTLAENHTWLARRNGSVYFTGNTNHPSEILVFGQRTSTEFLELLLRVQLQRVNTDDQKEVVRHLFKLYGNKLEFGIDKNGIGMPLWDQLTRESFGDRVYGFHDTENRVFAIEDRDLKPGEKPEDLIRKRPTIECSTDWLRNNHVDTGNFRLPSDNEIIRQFQGQTVSTVRDPGSPYGIKRQYSGGGLHALDGAKNAVAAKYIPPLEKFLERKPEPPRAPVLDVFIGADYY